MLSSLAFLVQADFVSPLLLLEVLQQILGSWPAALAVVVRVVVCPAAGI